MSRVVTQGIFQLLWGCELAWTSPDIMGLRKLYVDNHCSWTCQSSPSSIRKCTPISWTNIEAPKQQQTYGGFHKWGYSQSSSILDWDFPWNKPTILRYPHGYGNPPIHMTNPALFSVRLLWIATQEAAMNGAEAARPQHLTVSCWWIWKIRMGVPQKWIVDIYTGNSIYERCRITKWTTISLISHA